MIRPNLSEVRDLAKEGNLIPIWTEVPADLETPASVYLKLRGEGPSFLLESVERGEQVGRYSFLGFDPVGVLTAQDGRVVLKQNGRGERLFPTGDPLAAMEEILAGYRPVIPADIPEFFGGLVGYLSYDAVRYFERAPLPPGPGLSLPDAVFLLSDTVAIFDHVKRLLKIVVNVHVEEGTDPESVYASAVERIRGLVDALRRPLTDVPDAPAAEAAEAEWSSNVEQAAYEESVERAKAYIRAGDIFQVVPSQRLSRRTAVDPFAVYRALRMLNPSPYMFFLDLPDGLQIIGSSPETMVRLQGRAAEVRPIAGTRRRGADASEDRLLAEELLADPKERAEHVMLVDLGRNDLGRVCEYGTVEVPELMKIEQYSHVMHIVSSVRGTLRPECGAFDLLRATFPAGTVSGAPKVRAMEIIAELEGERRGPYAGAVGYFGYSGVMDTCIAIRTLVMHAGSIHVQAGAGIVADSVPTTEFEETLSKARALAVAVDRTEHAATAEEGGSR